MIRLFFSVQTFLRAGVSVPFFRKQLFYLDGSGLGASK